jgi:cytochrome b561
MSEVKYPKAVMVLHWFMFGLISVGVALILIREIVEGKPLRTWMLNAHKVIGLLIPITLLIRIAVVTKYNKLLPVHPLNKLTKIAAKITHLALYFALAAVPLLGWAHVNAKGQVASFLGIIPLPSLVQEDIDLAEQLADWHEWLAYSLLALVAAHVLAALWHHYFKKDSVLIAMAPIFNKKSKI